jgi:TPR repeat protein
MYVTEPDEIIFACGLRAAREGRYKDAYDLWQPLAVNGHRLAQRNIGCLFYLGLGVRRDVQEAADWVGRAAARPEEQDPVAVFRRIDHLEAVGKHGAVFSWAAA